MLLLSDAAGVTVEYLGEEAQKQELRRSGLWLGAEWSEARAGTCALGACIETGEPLIIHQSDHFDVTHGGLSCTAAPIYDTEGRLAAVLDISLLSSPLARASQFLALNLVRQTARRIEMANIMAESRADWVLRLAGSPDFLDVDPQAAIRLDQAGRVIGMTHGAARLMARSLGQDWREAGGLIGRPISEMFNLDLGDLEGLTRSHAARDRLLETRDGYRLFAHAIEPRRSPPVAPALSRPQAIPAALRDLAGDDPVMRALSERAAALAPGRLPLLIVGPPGSGKSTLARAIHDTARRGPFMTVACDTLSEEEAAILFGRGDPRNYQPGLIDAAEGGTLVLDRPGALPARMQARLMTLITERSFRPVGALRERASTARLLITQSDAEGLREDILHRIAGTQLRLPPLAARQDLVDLAARIFSRAFGVPVRFSPGLAAALTGWSWPGNLAELAALAEGLATGFITRRPGEPLHLEPEDLPAQFRAAAATPKDSAAILLHLLNESGWNVSAVARDMGVDRSTIHRQIRRHGLRRSD